MEKIMYVCKCGHRFYSNSNRCFKCNGIAKDEQLFGKIGGAFGGEFGAFIGTIVDIWKNVWSK